MKLGICLIFVLFGVTGNAQSQFEYKTVEWNFEDPKYPPLSYYTERFADGTVDLAAIISECQPIPLVPEFHQINSTTSISATFSPLLTCSGRYLKGARNIHFAAPGSTTVSPNGLLGGVELDLFFPEPVRSDFIFNGVGGAGPYTNSYHFQDNGPYSFFLALTDNLGNPPIPNPQPVNCTTTIGSVTSIQYFGPITPELIGHYDVGIRVERHEIPADGNARMSIQCTRPITTIFSNGAYVAQKVKFNPEVVYSAWNGYEDIANEVLIKKARVKIKTEKFCHVKDKGRIVPFFSQLDPAWRSHHYNHGTKTMGAKGCAVSSLAMILGSYGLSEGIEAGEQFNPGTFNAGLKTYGDDIKPNGYGFDSDHNILWQGASLYARDAFAEQCLRRGGSLENCLTSAINSVAFKGKFVGPHLAKVDIESELCNGNPVLVEVPSKNNPGSSHFVVAVGVTVHNGQRTFSILNPESQRSDEVPLNSVYEGVKGVRLFRPSADPSMLFVHASENVELLVTDPQGRRTGFSPIFQSLSEIPDALYSLESGVNDLDLSDGTDDSTSARQVFQHMEQPLTGNYRIQVFGAPGSNFSVRTYGFDAIGALNSWREINGVMSSSGTMEYYIQHSEAPYVQPKSKLTVTNLTLKSKPRKNEDGLVLIGKLIGPNGTPPPLSHRMTIKVGGYSLNIDKASFRRVKLGSVTTYIYEKIRGERLLIIYSSNGTFAVYSGNAQVGPLSSGPVSVEVRLDSTIGAKSVQLKCSRNLVCTGK